MQVPVQFEATGVMRHLLGALSDDSEAASRSRCAAMRAMAALCRTAPRAHAEFLRLGGVSVVLQTLLQLERGSTEHLSAVRLVADGLAQTPECRALVAELGGIDLLVQVFRDSQGGGSTRRSGGGGFSPPRLAGSLPRYASHASVYSGGYASHNSGYSGGYASHNSGGYTSRNSEEYTSNSASLLNGEGSAELTRVSKQLCKQGSGADGAHAAQLSKYGSGTYNTQAPLSRHDSGHNSGPYSPQQKLQQEQRQQAQRQQEQQERVERQVQKQKRSAQDDDAKLHAAALMALARLTYAHPTNQASLESAARLLSCDDVVSAVAALQRKHAAEFDAQAAAAAVQALQSQVGRECLLPYFAVANIL